LKHYEHFVRDVSVDNEELIKFWKLSAYESRSMNLKKTQHSKTRHFLHN